MTARPYDLRSRKTSALSGSVQQFTERKHQKIARQARLRSSRPLGAVRARPPPTIDHSPRLCDAIDGSWFYPGARVYRLLLPVFAALVCFGVSCAPQVGDACITSQECSPGQVCDTSSPRGYCTLFDCEANDCPGNSVCVDFGDVRACMERCDSNNECRQRDGYECRDDLGPASFCYLPLVVEGSGN